MLGNSWDVGNSCQNQHVTPLSPVGLSLLCSSKGQISSSLHSLFESFSRLTFSKVHSEFKGDVLVGVSANSCCLSSCFLASFGMSCLCCLANCMLQKLENKRNILGNA